MASNETQKLQSIDLQSLTIQQLSQIKQQLDQELGVFQDSLQTLKMAQGKFQYSEESLNKITTDSEGKEILVPLTGSMYVPGKIADSQSVIIDIGTGYYIQKDVGGAKDYFKRKVKFVTEQMEKIQTLGIEKNTIREAVIDVLESKIQAQLASSQQAQPTAVKS